MLMRLPISVKLLATSLIILFTLAACSSGATPAPSQANSQQSDQQVVTEFVTEIPTEIIEETATTPAQSLDVNPTPEENYPAPELGYPAPDENFPTPTVAPAYPAPEEEQGGLSTPDAANQPPIKTGLEATNPSTVNLASGGLQFVEFFAFW